MSSIKTLSIKTLYGTYEVRAESNRSEKGYTVTVPRLRGIVTCGDTIFEVKKMAKEAIELHCEGLFTSGLAEIKISSRAHAVA
jgi:predicted RNase H-like HicB family nuclease